MDLTMCISVYIQHTHTHTHTQYQVTHACWKVVHWHLVRFPLPLLHQHNHFHWLLGCWSPYLEINIDIRTQIFQFPTQTLKASLKRGKWICVFPCPLVISKVAHRSCIHLQTHTAQLAPPHGTSKGTARTNVRPATLRLGVNWIPGHLSKAWELSKSQALWCPHPATVPAAIPAGSSLLQSLSPSGSFSVLSCPWPSSDLFALFTPFLSRPQKTAKALHCVDHNKLTSFQLQPHAPHLLNRSPEAQIVRRRRSKPGAISFFLGLLGSSSGLPLGADICGGEDAQETFCPRNLPASRLERTGRPSGLHLLGCPRLRSGNAILWNTGGSAQFRKYACFLWEWGWNSPPDFVAQSVSTLVF